MSKVYFSESQSFDQLWMKLLMIAISAGALIPLAVACYRQLILGQPWGQQAPSNFVMLYITLAMVLIVVGVNVLVFGSRLETKITSQGIQYRFRPFTNQWKVIHKQQLDKAEVRKYHARKEFGGRGYKFFILNKKGRGLTIKGDQGLQLIFKDGKKLLLGTQRAMEMKIALQKYLENLDQS